MVKGWSYFQFFIIVRDRDLAMATWHRPDTCSEGARVLFRSCWSGCHTVFLAYNYSCWTHKCGKIFLFRQPLLPCQWTWCQSTCTLCQSKMRISVIDQSCHSFDLSNNGFKNSLLLSCTTKITHITTNRPLLHVPITSQRVKMNMLHILHSQRSVPTCCKFLGERMLREVVPQVWSHDRKWQG